MPELPEVETITRDLRGLIVGRQLVGLATRQPKAINLPSADFVARLGQDVLAVDRHGKSIVVSLSTDSLWIHLGLNGQALFDEPGTPALETPSMVALDFADGSRLRLEKLFMGHAHLLGPAESAARLATLGPDPFSSAISPTWLAEIAAAKPALGVKALLTDQKVIAGVGNSYADEALHRAGIQPNRRLGSLSTDDCSRLIVRLLEVLEDSIALGGDESYTDAHGRPGRFTSRVHSRTVCVTCGGPVSKLTLGGRGSYFCPTCQQ